MVLRVSSPGGSALGSDTIHRAIARLKEAGKPVVCSMGDVAASGGIFLAVAADHIVAQPGTLTGSIGVVTGKVNMSPMLADLGVNIDSIKVGDNVDLLSPYADLSVKQEAQINALMDHIYSDFMGKVAAGRGMGMDRVRALAKGQVYTGQQALEVRHPPASRRRVGGQLQPVGL